MSRPIHQVPRTRALNVAYLARPSMASCDVDTPPPHGHRLCYIFSFDPFQKVLEIEI